MGSEENGDRGTIAASNGVDPFYGSNLDPIMSLSLSGNSALVFQDEFAENPHFSALLQHQSVESSSLLVHYQPDTDLADMVPKVSTFGGVGFGEMVDSFGSKGSRFHSNFAQDNGVRIQRTLTTFKIDDEQQQKNPSEVTCELLEEDGNTNQTNDPNWFTRARHKKGIDQEKGNTADGESLKEDYIHMRAKRGQATNSHSLAERVRRERISMRMKLLQELVPGCNKITGKAVMLDEIINYVQSLQKQVEFLSMKLATVNPELNMDIEHLISNRILNSRGSNANILEDASGMSSSQHFPGFSHGNFHGIPCTIPPSSHHLQHDSWNTDQQSIFSMGFDSTTPRQNGL